MGRFGRYRNWPLSLLALAGCLCLLGARPVPVAVQRLPVRTLPTPASGSRLTGWLSLLWEDPPPGAPPEAGPITLFTDDRGHTYRLAIPDSLAQQLGGIQALDRRRVTVQGNWLRARGDVVRVSTLQAAAGPQPPDELSQSDLPGPKVKSYALILCRFADTTGFTPHPPSWYEGLMSDQFPGASHYWQETSFNTINVAGSVVFGWYDLPRPRPYYLNGAGDALDTAKLFADATAVADADIYYPSFAGINILVNDDLVGPAKGGTHAAILDGESRLWPATWVPLWGHNPDTLAHEMGHSLGLSHSSGPYQATYDSRWDVMSGGGNSLSPDPMYGRTPVHLIAWHKDKLGWIPPKRKYVAQPGSHQTIQLMRLAQPLSGDDYLMAQIFIGGWATRFYTVELRQFAGYDSQGGLPGEAVVIHRVDTALPDRNAQVVDVDGNGDANDEGAMWSPGETFTDTEHSVTITIESATATGMSVTISVGSDVPLPSVVASTGDQGPATLRNAILYANQFPGTAIDFNIQPGDAAFREGVFTLQPTAPLPVIQANGTLIDAGSQTLHTSDTNAGRPSLVLNGALAGDGAIGLQIAGAGCQVRRLTINGFGGPGIQIFTPAAQGNLVQGCFIGVNASGTGPVPNGGPGLQLVWGAKENLIGGTTPDTRNVIAGNRGSGVLVDGAGTDGNRIEGNFIGIDATGQLPIANGSHGLLVHGGARGNMIGGVAVGAGNLVSGNSGEGIRIEGEGTTETVVQGNFVGTNVTGQLAVPNGSHGVIVFFRATGSILGGPATGAGNLVSGNAGDGIRIESEGTTETVVEGNLVGTDATGTAAIPNDGNGVNVAFGPRDNTIGGPTAGARNLIAGNREQGLMFYGTGTDGNRVQGNFIGTDTSGQYAIANGAHGVIVFGGARGNTIGGAASGAANLISGNAQDGILIANPMTDGNVIQGNRIGTNLLGERAISNGFHGVEMSFGPRENVIGGTGQGAGNLIAGNRQFGLVFYGEGTDSNTVQGNFIGTDAAGQLALPNRAQGVIVFGGARRNTIGGSVAGAGNLVSGNGSEGIRIEGEGTAETVVQGNRVGTDASGMAALPNGAHGVSLLSGTQLNLIGGLTPGAGNLIGGNRGNGLILSGAGTRGNVVLGNAIGTDFSGARVLGNRGHGIFLGGGASGNAIGGTVPGAGNRIAFSGGDGIRVADSATLGNTLRANAISRSTGLGINLVGGSQYAYGVSANDPGDADSGPNSLQNYPVIEDVNAASGETLLIGTLNSTPATTFEIDVYASPERHPSGYGEGTLYLGTTSVTTDGNGNAAFLFPLGSALSGLFFTTTATNLATGDTSEFCQARKGF